MSILKLTLVLNDIYQISDFIANSPNAVNAQSQTVSNARFICSLFFRYSQQRFEPLRLIRLDLI